MTETVKCRVCDCLSPLGTVECPDCGAPLPRELPKEETPLPPSEAEDAQPEAGRNKKEKHPARHPLLRRVACFVAVCLGLELALFALPQKQPPPGVVLTAGGFVTPDGVWDYEADGFFFSTATSDGRYVILQQVGEEALSKVKPIRSVLSSSSVNLSYTYAPDGDYYLFDGRTLERTDWDTVTLTDSGAVFYTVQDDTGTALFHRDLPTGKVREIDRVEGEVDLTDLRPSADGTAAAYRWRSGEGVPGATYLWRRKDDRSVDMKVGQEDYLLGVGSAGKNCLFQTLSRDEGAGGTVWSWGTHVYGGYDGGYYGSNHYLWQDGSIVPMYGMRVMWNNSGYTQFLLQEDGVDYVGDWYYLDVDAMTQPVKLDLSLGGYLVPVGVSFRYDQDSLGGRYYYSWGSDDGKVYYLTPRGELVPVEESLEGSFLTDPGGQTAVYLKDGDLYRAAVLPDETVETGQLTQTAGSLTSSDLDAGSVDAFAANGNLTHIYYVAQSPEGYRGGKVLYHWHDGESHALDFQYGLTYNAYQGAIEVTPEGGCYFQNSGDVYYTAQDAPPTLVLEDAGIGTQPQLVGPDQWPLVTGATWEGGESKQLYWRLDGEKEPVGLTAWTPKEGKI